jgi:hypothetical protein
MSENPYKPPGDNLASTPRLRWWEIRSERFIALGVGFAIGAALSYLAGRLLLYPPGLCMLIVTGPWLGTLHGIKEVMLVGWIGALLSLAGPLRPSMATGFVTSVGLFLWFFSGLMGLAIVFEK